MDANPDYLEQYPLPPVPKGCKYWRCPFKCKEDMESYLTQDVLRKIHRKPESSEGKQRIVVFRAIAFAAAYHNCYGQIRTQVKLQGIGAQQYDNHIRALLRENIIYTNVKPRKGSSLSCAPFLRKIKDDIDAKKIVETKSLPKPARVLNVIRGPERYSNEKYLLQKDSSGKPQRITRKHVFSVPHVRVELAKESLIRIHPQYKSEEGQSCIEVFNIAAFGIEKLSDGSIKRTDAGKRTQQTYSSIIRKAKTFSIDKETVEKHLDAMLESKVLYTRRNGSALYFYATVFLNDAVLKPKDEDNDDVDDDDGKRAAPIVTPEFMKGYPAPSTDAKRWARRKMEQDVRIALHKDSLRQIHPEYETSNGDECLTVFNAAAFGIQRDDDGTVVKPDKMIPSLMTFGVLVRKCATFGIPQERVDEHLEGMMERQVLFTGKDRSSYFLLSTPFLRHARLLTDPKGYDWTKNVSTRPQVRIPEFFAMFKEAVRVPGEKRPVRKSMPKDVEKALSDHSLALIHPDVQSADASDRFAIFNIIAFGTTIDSLVEDAEVHVSARPTYNRLLETVGVKMNMSKDDLDEHLHEMMKRAVLHVRAKDNVITPTEFLCNAELRENDCVLLRNVEKDEEVDDADTTNREESNSQEYLSSRGVLDNSLQIRKSRKYVAVPEFVRNNPKPNPPGGKKRWGNRPKMMSHDLSQELPPNKLRIIVGDGSEKDQRLRLEIANRIAFKTDNISYCGLFSSLSCELDEFQRCLECLFDEKAVYSSCKKKKSGAQYYLTMLPFLHRCFTKRSELVTPDYMKQFGDSNDSSKFVASELWKFDNYLKDVRAVLTGECLKNIRGDWDGEDAWNCVTVFNIVAYSIRRKTENGIEYGGKDGPFYVYYGQIVRAGESFGMENIKIDAYLKDLLERNVLRSYKENDGRYRLSAAVFLHNSDLREDVLQPKKKQKRMETHFVSRVLNSSSVDKPVTRISMPEKYKDDKYRFKKPPNGLERWSRAIMKPNVIEALNRDALLRIHPQYDSCAEGSLVVAIMNLISFPGHRSNSFSALVRAALHEHRINRQDFEKGLSYLLERKCVFVRTRGRRGKISEWIFTSTPFLSLARLDPGNQVEKREKKRRILVSNREKARKSRKTLTDNQEAASLKIKAYQTKIHASRCAEEDVELGEESTCVGFGENACIFGIDGQPQQVDSETWYRYFGTVKRKNGLRRAKQCSRCSFLRGVQTKSTIHCNHVKNNHTDFTMPTIEIRLAIQDLVDTYKECELCGGEFCQDPETDSIPQNAPWKQSLNVKQPKKRKRFATREEMVSACNVVHVVCNQAQKNFDFEEVQEVCRFIAEKLTTNDNSRRVVTKVQSKSFSHTNVYGTAWGHGFDSKQTKQIVEQSLVTPEQIGFLTIGDGIEFDLDLSDYPNKLFHPLLSMTIDRKDGDGSPTVDNFQVIPRIYNNVKSHFTNDVVVQWLKFIKTKYAPVTD